MKELNAPDYWSEYTSYSLQNYLEYRQQKFHPEIILVKEKEHSAFKSDIENILKAYGPDTSTYEKLKPILDKFDI
ncbi:hypothetical protein RclHR1_18170002 [Rhizophagus clarus]|nr:hypothetical protein RclHR1_18170002 [Rhizophagus clarus]